MKTNIINEIPELKYGCEIYAAFFIVKNLIVFILIHPVKYVDEYIKTFTHYTAFKIFVVNLVIFCGFVQSIIRADATLYKKILLANSVLYFYATVKCISLLYIFIKEKINVYWILVVLIMLVSLAEFIYTYSKRETIEVLSIENILKVTNDSLIIKAHKARCNVQADKLGIFVLSYFLTLNVLWGKAHNLTGIIDRRNKGFLNYAVELIMEAIIMVLNIATLVCISYKFDYENITQRKVALYSQLGNFVISSLIFIDFLLQSPSVMSFLFEFMYIYNFLFIFYSVYTIKKIWTTLVQG